MIRKLANMEPTAAVSYIPAVGLAAMDATTRAAITDSMGQTRKMVTSQATTFFIGLPFS
mgnify:FL=1